MSFVSQFKIDQLKNKLCDDEAQLKKIYKAKKSEFIQKSVSQTLVDDLLKDGWEEEKQLTYKTVLKMKKTHSKQFEDDVWCQLYELGYRTMNYDENFFLPFSNNDEDKKQIDIIAVDKETVLLVECKSSEKARAANSLRDIFDSLGNKLDGFRKVIDQTFGKGRKVKYIFATRNLRIDQDTPDMLRLQRAGAFYFNDNTYSYINSLIKSYKGIALFQFLGLIFKNELINSQKIEIPAVEGDMGGKRYYMFSIEPSLILKMGFVLHRTKANESEFPTYQRLLIPSRIKGITKYIDKGGYFPNSIILNFSAKKHRIQFEASTRSADSASRFGTLKIPNAYAIAYIIDGQHRVYGYANSLYKETNTIPVVAFDNLTTIEQLEIFMDINQNQKAVSPSLRYDLEEDLFWDSDRADSRLKALRSSIIKGLANSTGSALFNKISIGEDSAMLPFKPFYTALAKSGLLPSAKGNQYDADYLGAIYNTRNQNHSKEMDRVKKYTVQFLTMCYNFVQDHYPQIFEREPQSLIISPRGTFAYIGLIGSVNAHLVSKGQISTTTSTKDRFNVLEKYLTVLLDYLSNISKEEEEAQFSLLGSGADTRWLRYFQAIVNQKFKDYNPEELKDWKERQDEDLQTEARKLIVSIEKKMKKMVLSKIQILYGDHWELEINSIKRECQDRAEKEMEKNYKEGLKGKNISWTEMLSIMDYKTIIEKYFGKSPENVSQKDFATYEKDFAINCGFGFNSKSEKLKWISLLNSYRNQVAHEGSKEHGLNKEEVQFIRKIYQHFEQFT